MFLQTRLQIYERNALSLHEDECMINAKELFENKYVFFLPPVKTLTEFFWSKSFPMAAAPPPQDCNKL